MIDFYNAEFARYKSKDTYKKLVAGVKRKLKSRCYDCIDKAASYLGTTSCVVSIEDTFKYLKEHDACIVIDDIMNELISLGYSTVLCTEKSCINVSW